MGVDVHSGEILASLTGCLTISLLCCLSPPLALTVLWISLRLGWNSHSVHSFQASHCLVTIFILSDCSSLDFPERITFQSLNKEIGWKIFLISLSNLLLKTNHCFSTYIWGLNLRSVLGGGVAWNSLNCLTTSLPTHSLLRLEKLSFLSFYCIPGTSPNVISSSLWRWHQKNLIYRKK